MGDNQRNLLDTSQKISFNTKTVPRESRLSKPKFYFPDVSTRRNIPCYTVE